MKKNMKIGLLVPMNTQDINASINALHGAFPKTSHKKDTLVISGFIESHTTQSVFDFITDNELNMLFLDENDELDYDEIEEKSEIVMVRLKNAWKKPASEQHD